MGLSNVLKKLSYSEQHKKSFDYVPTLMKVIPEIHREQHILYFSQISTFILQIPDN